MATSTNLISGLASGFDWRSMVDQLIEIEHRRVDLVENRKTEYENKLAEWQKINTQLLTLKTAASTLASESAFKVFTSSLSSNSSTAASELMSVSVGSTASAGTYNIKVNNLAQSEKISSQSYTACDTALSVAGDILVSGKVVNVAATDSLADIQDKINAVNTGASPSRVTASIVQHSSTDFHLVLASDETGEDGIDILEASSGNVLRNMGFIDSTAGSIQHATSSGAQSDLFTDAGEFVGTLLELTTPPGATTVTIGGQAVSIDLAGESITAIAASIDALAGVSASVVSEEDENGETKYRIDVSGTTSFVDNGNVLQTLGILKGNYGSVSGLLTADTQYALGTGAAVTATTTWSNLFTGSLREASGHSRTTAAGGGAITAATRWDQIDTGGDANDIEGGETIRLQGATHSGAAVDATYEITDASADLSGFLTWVESQFGGSAAADAYLDSSGRLVVEDKLTGSSQLNVGPVSTTGTALTFGAFGNDIATGDTITISGQRYNDTTDAYETFSSAFTITTTEQLSGLLTEIETRFNLNTATDHRVDAYVSDGTDGNTAGQLVIKDLTTGDTQISASLVANNQGGGTLDFGTLAMTTEGRSMQIAAGEDAEISVDNVIIHKASNDIDDVIPGATLSLSGESTSTTLNLKISRDTSEIKSNIKSMADAYNSIMSYITTQFSYDEKTKKTGGILFGDGTLSTLKSELVDLVTGTITGLSSEYNRLPLIGIALNEKAQLTIDDTKLTNALKTNFDDVKKLFIANGAGSNALLSYVGHTDDTQGGSYEVNITQAATQTTVTGSAALAGALSTDETLSITDFATQRVAAVDLTAGMTLDDIVNAINSEMDKSYTQQLQGDSATGFTSSTAFSDIAGAEVGDTITFTGTRRNGLLVTGSYEITDTSKTLTDLLNEISDMFAGDATVSLSGTGKLTVTDKQTGDSYLSFGINTSAVSGLSFGTIGTVTDGRSGLPIAASKDGSNHLVLTHEVYGTGHIIVASESGGTELGLNDATQVYGVNVAGTINGVTAAGAGQTLTLSSAGNDADGLSLMYTGTGTGAITMDFTLGVADLLNRQLGFLTQTEGTVAFKEASLQNSIDSFTTQIEQMEAALERKQEAMINRYVVMETALNKLSSQSSWLTSQITALQSSW